MNLDDLKPLSLFPYPGGKAQLSVLRKILAYAPDTIREFREPFSGACSVSLAIKRLHPDANIWLNDKDNDVVNVQLALRDCSDEFIGRCEEIEGMGQGERRDLYDDIWFDEEMDRALRYYLVRRWSFCGQIDLNVPKPGSFSAINAAKGLRIENLKLISELLQGARITNGDYSALLKEGGEGVWIYCDPPYVCNLKHTKRERFYPHTFFAADHERFAADIRRCTHDCLITYDDCDEVRSLYRPTHGFKLRREQWVYRMGMPQGGAKKKMGKELFISNREKRAPAPAVRPAGQPARYDFSGASSTVEWLTPPQIIEELGPFDLDPCSPVNRPWDTAKVHYTIEDDGLSKPWSGRVWLNPPYGRVMGAWLAKMAEHGNGIALIPARTGGRIYHKHVLQKADALFFLRGRMKFHLPNGERANNPASFASLFVAYGAENVAVLKNLLIPGQLLHLNLAEVA